MKRLTALLLSILMICGTVSFSLSAKVFSDVSEGDWFYPCVIGVTEKGYMVGVSESEFAPRDTVTRAMMMQVLYKLSGESVEFTPYFDDVKENHWYAPAVTWAKERGVSAGVSETHFSPNTELTREQLACFYHRYAELYSITLAEKDSVDYLDKNLISEWARASVEKMNSAAIISTRFTNSFLPRGGVSRAELAGSLLRLSGDYEKGVYDSSKHISSLYTEVASAELTVGQSINMGVSFLPLDADDTLLYFFSSAPSVASVDSNGNIKALSQGSANITVTSRDDNYTAVCKITVYPASTLTLPGIGNISYSSQYKAEMKPIGRVVDPNKPMVALTYDDGPRPKSTNRILNCLEKYDSVATFFELGYLAQTYPDCIRREVALGCEVANHSWDHPNLATLSGGGVASQINSTSNTIYNICGVKPTLLRPPYGSYNSTVRNNCGMPIIIWSIDTLDWKYRDANYVTSVIKNQVTDGSVILMHSIYDSTAAATEQIVPWLISRGYQLVTVSELAEARGITLQSGAAYHSFYKKAN